MAACLSSLQNELNSGSSSFVALDVECYQPDAKKPACYAANYEPLATRVQTITDAIHALNGTTGVKRVLIYTNASNWSFLTGNDKTLQQLAAGYGLWNAAHGSFTGYSDPAGNVYCAPTKYRKKSLIPTAHGGTGIPSLNPPATITAFSIANNVVTFSG